MSVAGSGPQLVEMLLFIQAHDAIDAGDIFGVRSLDKVERRRRWEAELAAAGVYNSDDKIEKWIRMEAARRIVLGEGRWVDSPETAFGKPIYHLSYGPVTLILSQAGFTYEGPSPSFEHRYDEIETINPPTLHDCMMVRGNVDKMMFSELVMRAAPFQLEMQLQACLGWVVNVIDRIIREFT
jgi:hypothetical protein